MTPSVLVTADCKIEDFVAKEGLSVNDPFYRKMVGYMGEYLKMIMEVANLDLDAAWKVCEPQFAKVIHTGISIDPNSFDPLITDVTKYLTENVPMNRRSRYYHKPSDPNFSLEWFDQTFQGFIHRAYTQAINVISKHEWLKGTCTVNEMVGIFTTFLRRESAKFVIKVPSEISSFKFFLQKLYDPNMWMDVGVPGGSRVNNWVFSCTYRNVEWKMDDAKMNAICDAARSFVPAEEINSGLAILERDLYPLKSGIDKMVRINQEAEQIMSNLCAAAEGR